MRTTVALFWITSLSLGCATSSGSSMEMGEADEPRTRDAEIAPAEPPGSGAAPGGSGGEPSGSGADVIAVEASGSPGDYSFSVRLRSPDTGCDRYASYWEVLTADGELRYRRILAHSHVDEQPFTRSGGPVAVEPDDELLVRAYMHPDGYGGMAMGGTIASGFEPTELATDFAAAVADADPQPGGCAF